MKKRLQLNTGNRFKISGMMLGILIVFLILSNFGYGQRNYLFENISIPQGLSNPEVHFIYHDSNGFLWVSTADGLNRYDGNNFTVFKNDPGDSTSMTYNYCSAITEDNDGNIWVSIFGNQIARFNPKNETFENFPIDKGTANEISDAFTALTDSKGNIWFGTTNHGIQKLNKTTNKFEKIPLDTTNLTNQWGQIYYIKELKNGNIIASDYGNGILIYDQKRNVFQAYYLKTNYSPREIYTIYEDASANIWFGGNTQLIKYTPAYYTTEEYNPFRLFLNPTNYDNVAGIIQDEDGYFWTGIYSQGLFRIDPKSKEIESFDFGFQIADGSIETNINVMVADKFGVIWIGTTDYGLIKFDPLREPFKYIKIKSDETSASGIGLVSSIAGLQNNNLVTIGTTSKGLFTYDLENKQTKKLKVNYDITATTDESVNINAIAIDEEGNRWFAYNNLGLHKLDKNNQLQRIETPPDRTNSGSYRVSDIKIDLSGNIWLADPSGFEKYEPAKKQISLLPTIMNKKMSPKLKQKVDDVVHQRKPICAILQVGEASNLEKKFTLETNQKVMIVSVGEGRMAQGNDGLFDKGALMEGDGILIWSMNDLARSFNDGGGFKNRIVIKCLELKKGDYKMTFSTDVGHSYANWNVQAPPDSLWYGIQILKVTDSEFDDIRALNESEIISDSYMPLEAGTCMDMSKKFNNVVWLGSQRNGFFKYDLLSGEFKQYNFDLKSKFSPNNTITDIYEDRDGWVWVATQNSLLQFDPVTETVAKYNQKDGLPSNLINSIIEDLEGNLWLSTSNGLSKLNKTEPREKWNFVNFDTKDGLPGFSSSKASWIGKDGDIVLGSNDGIVSFFPGKNNKIKPDIVLEDIKISDVSLKAGKLNKSIMKLDHLVLSHTQNNLSFEFASIHYSRPEKNKVLYMLEGFNSHWISTNRNFASYTNLAPGKYTLRIKGSNGDGIWNNEGKSISFIIRPPWWQSKIAFGIYILFFALLIFGADRFFRQRAIKNEQERNRAREVEQAREIEKAYTELKATQSQLIQAEKMASLGELTAGIAHEIQNPLNFVNNFSEVNAELITELLEERKKQVRDFENEEEILNNIKENEQKINHHGKRAESIVKGMLMHSRGNSGQKELTDINALADEFVRLSYHGLRAKDKSFNADFKLDLEEDLPKINVVPQDFGRVILNLINNAFYAVSEKSRSGIQNFSPKIIVTTRKIGQSIEIRVKDNGNGFPVELKEKIFQPFFTTKPAGQGTGLGLSLSYDIIKAHAGEFKVESNEREGTEFSIVLPIKPIQ